MNERDITRRRPRSDEGKILIGGKMWTRAWAAGRWEPEPSSSVLLQRHADYEPEPQTAAEQQDKMHALYLGASSAHAPSGVGG